MESDGFGDSELIFSPQGTGRGLRGGGVRNEVGGWGKELLCRAEMFLSLTQTLRYKGNPWTKPP